jgi:hypothetical protein
MSASTSPRASAPRPSSASVAFKANAISPAVAASVPSRSKMTALTGEFIGETKKAAHEAAFLIDNPRNLIDTSGNW